jgi:hypothetical protein
MGLVSQLGFLNNFAASSGFILLHQVPLYTIVRHFDHGTLESPQNASEGRHMEIQKLLMCGPRFLNVI